MKTFNEFLTEKKADKPAVFTFGRFNPPTIGHGKLAAKLEKVARSVSGDALLFSSHSNDKVKNPLPHRQKIKWLKKFFGKKITVVDANVRTVFEIANEIYKQGYRNLVMVVGSDRVQEFRNILTKYNKVKGRHGYYNFDMIEIVSAGERDENASDVTGMSASKMRAYAEKGDFDNFKQGVPVPRFADALYKDVRKGMGITEETMPKYMIEDLITEGVYDPGIFKAIFLAGGPGSGKSTFVKKLALDTMGLKSVNSDKAFENGLKKAGLGLDLRNMDPADRDPIRAKAKTLTGKSLDMYLGGRLGVTFDTTSAKSNKIKNYKKLLDKLGYEYKMIYVSASLKNAQARNAMRSRKLPPQVVQNDWEAANKNALEFKKIFGRDFIEVTNNDDIDSFDKKASALYSKIMSWASTFPGNKIATSWKEQELLRKKS